jgi:hypothetical protein
LSDTSIQPYSIFQEIRGLDGHEPKFESFCFDRAEIGLYSDLVNNSSRTFKLVRDVRQLVQQGILTCERDPWLSFEIAEASKAEILEGISQSEQVEVLCHVTSLVSTSFPDPFTEALWAAIAQSSREIIESTVIPFLSVVSDHVVQSYL